MWDIKFISVNKFSVPQINLEVFCRIVWKIARSHRINLSNFACIASSSSAQGLHEFVSNVFTRLMIALRRNTMTVALQQTTKTLTDIKEILVKSSMLSTVRKSSMNCVTIRKYNWDSVQEVNTVYNNLAQLDDHPIGCQIPVRLHMRKFNDRICIFVIALDLVKSFRPLLQSTVSQRTCTTRT